MFLEFQSYQAAHPLSNWHEFIPYRKDWSGAVIGTRILRECLGIVSSLNGKDDPYPDMVGARHCSKTRADFDLHRAR
jgi:hypothetical protein